MIVSPTASRTDENTSPRRTETTDGFQRAVMSDTLLVALGSLVAVDRSHTRLVPPGLADSARRLRHHEPAI